MGVHLIEGEFQSDKYPTTPRGKVPLSVKDPMAQDLLWEYAKRRSSVDAEFSNDLAVALRTAGYVPGRAARVARDGEGARREGGKELGRGGGEVPGQPQRRCTAQGRDAERFAEVFL